MTATGTTITGSTRRLWLPPLSAFAPPILFGVRMWVSVCLSLYVAFWLQLDNPSWAGTTAAIVCQPQLGASLRKSSYRMIGTAIGAVAIVVLCGLFRQERVNFLVGLAVWCAVCGFVAGFLSNFAAYGSALSGYTAAILASDVLGQIGDFNTDVFTLAVYRVAAICLGIVAAGVVLALTDFGQARRKLAAEFASLSQSISAGLLNCFVSPGEREPQFQSLRRDLFRRVIALEPLIDTAVGEFSDLRHRSPVLQAAVDGLFEALTAWRRVARQRDGTQDTEREAQSVYRRLPVEPLAAPPGEWMERPDELRQVLCMSARNMAGYPAETPSSRLIADCAAQGMAGLARAVNGLTLIVDPSRALRAHSALGWRVADWLPAVVAAVRTLAIIGLVSLFWIVTGWPGGATAVTFAAITAVLFPLQGDKAYSASLNFLFGCFLGAAVATVVEFWALPQVEGFPGLCLALAVIIPLGALMATPLNPVVFMAAAVNFIPMLSLQNVMTYDASQFWNTVLAINAGVGVACVAMLVLPGPPPAMRARRLLTLQLADLRRVARRPGETRSRAWGSRAHARLLALPDQAEPIERAEFAAAQGVGALIIRLRKIAPRFTRSPALEEAFAAIGEGQSGLAIKRLHEAEREFAALPVGKPGRRSALRVCASILAVSAALAQYAPFFDAKPVR